MGIQAPTKRGILGVRCLGPMQVLCALSIGTLENLGEGLRRFGLSQWAELSSTTSVSVINGCLEEIECDAHVKGKKAGVSPFVLCSMRRSPNFSGIRCGSLLEV